MQKSLCSGIRTLDDELRVLEGQLAAAFGLQPEKMSLTALEKLCDADSSWQLRQALNDLAVVQKRVRRLNRVYAGLLSRSRRSINVLINVMANYMGTYIPPEHLLLRSKVRANCSGGRLAGLLEARDQAIPRPSLISITLLRASYTLSTFRTGRDTIWMVSRGAISSSRWSSRRRDGRPTRLRTWPWLCSPKD